MWKGRRYFEGIFECFYNAGLCRRLLELSNIKFDGNIDDLTKESGSEKEELYWRTSEGSH